VSAATSARSSTRRGGHEVPLPLLRHLRTARRPPRGQRIQETDTASYALEMMGVVRQFRVRGPHSRFSVYQLSMPSEAQESRVTTRVSNRELRTENRKHEVSFHKAAPPPRCSRLEPSTRPCPSGMRCCAHALRAHQTQPTSTSSRQLRRQPHFPPCRNEGCAAWRMW